VVRADATSGILQVRVTVEHALDTDDVTEAGNLYFTDQRADDRIAAASIDDLSDVAVSGAVSGDFLSFDGDDWVPDDSPVVSLDVDELVILTQDEYDALTPDARTVYLVVNLVSGS
jgi:hypothetical protein